MTTYNYRNPPEQLNNGDVLELRDFSALLTPESTAADRWQLRPYSLLDGTAGQMLTAHFYTTQQEQVPPELVFPLDLTGVYDVWFGSPVLSDHTTLDFPTGIDAAFGDDEYIHIGPEYGARRGRHLVEKDREIFTFFRRLDLTGKSLRLQVPFGTYLSQPLGLVQAALSCIRFVRPDSAPLPAAERPVMVVCDGFSHYWTAGKPHSNIDTRMIEALRDTAVTDFFFQPPATGVTSWQSRHTNYLGENMTDRTGKRFGDLRAADYIAWAIRNRREGMRVLPPKCRAAGMRFHASLRVNLFMHNDLPYLGGIEEYFNGRIWAENPQWRLDGGVRFDYRLPEARAYVAALFLELLKNFPDIQGINLDLTRWPPVLPLDADGRGILPLFVQELRNVLDGWTAYRGGDRLLLSLFVVDQYHAGMSLAAQNIHLDETLATGCVDFICAQAFAIAPIAQLCHRYSIPCHSIVEQTSPYYEMGSVSDENWRLIDGEKQDDPVAGEEHLRAPPVKSCLSPAEYDASRERAYRDGADGVCYVNRFMGQRTMRLGSGEEQLQTLGQYLFPHKPACNDGEPAV